ncbi:alpha-mannosidase 2 isoform X1 [Sitophilus oryzae]|uniref:Alpha-mannosidase n=1 Tax=Sitophilus oryzae TaxID=7048 RepID=A0A6J2YN57_SITOR|nr:alpha-mannosidase 2 isoform X1 [Sitophilus oryzae]XP_030764707.1 alpha-mannosidase 2 isoform X1 [Sitophilus oryzae]
MKLKRAVVIFGSLIILVIIFTIYSAKDLTLSVRKTTITQELKDNQWLHFEDRIKQLEDDLSRHHNAVAEIKIAMQNMLSSSTNSIPYRKANPVQIQTKLNINNMIYKSSCPFHLSFKPRTNVQMLDMYKILTFDNPDGGAWKQGWRIEVDEKDWNRHNKLKVFVVPHSHNDPGWTKTLDEYYITQTKHILDNMLVKLPDDPRRKFIWAEISYFSMWWEELESDQKELVKKLLHNNQLEIVTGGWVMNDEANSHFISIVHQLTEGHQWLAQNLNYTPVSHWSIDPFGMGLTQPAILKYSGLSNMLIQRVHYSVKKELAKTKQLEFRWRQLWDDSGDTDMFCHMMPFYGYDIPHTCGPDPKVCCQFDFKRLPNHGLHCPWKVPPVPITDKNVAARAEMLLDQYRKKSKLYKTNVVMAPLGDDFRYDHPTEWDVQYTNYQKLFDYMNRNLKLNVQAQFGTLTDYFKELRKSKDISEFPSLSGDFFTYADRDDHYWSGYYTSRPFYKRMDRVLLSYIRAAETLHALTYHSGKSGTDWIVDKVIGLEHLLINARQSLSLFQHHDGITGTAKDHVVIDYGKRLLDSIHNCQRVIQLCTNILLEGTGSQGPYEQDVNYYSFEDVWHSHNSLPERLQITIGVPDLPTKKIVIYNSLAFARHEVVTFHINIPFIKVFDFRGKIVPSQISPIFEYGSSMSQTKYELAFVANIPAFGTVSYTVTAVYEENKPKETVFPLVKIFNQYGDVKIPKGFKVDVSPSASEFSFQNGRVAASFNNLGLLKAIKTGSTTVPVHLDFAKYGVAFRQNSDRSGAYLFLPDGQAIEIKAENTIVNVIEGPIMSSVTVQLPHVKHKAILYNTPGADGLGIEIENTVDIQKTNNFEIVMRLSTNINNTDEFFTDANGYQMLRRKRFKKLPLQANYYPMPTKAYIEDKTTRLSILTSTPLGCSSLNEGKIEVMLDRRLSQDDNLGLGQGVLDNHPTKHIFRILIEKKTESCQATVSDHPAGFPTVSAGVASESLLNPLVKMLKTQDDEENKAEVFAPSFELGVDLSIPTFKTNLFIKEAYHTGLVIHRQFLDTCFLDKVLIKQFQLSDGKLNLKALFPNSDGKSLYKASLSFLKTEKLLDINDDIELCPMDMKAFYI